MLLNRNTALMDNVSPNSEMNIAAWLRGLDLDRYERAFRDNDIDADVLGELTADDLIALGITSVGHRRKLLAAIAMLKAESLEVANADPVSQSLSPPCTRSLSSTHAERRQVTVMFCDLVGSTALSRKLDLEDLREALGTYHAAVSAEVARFDGFVAKFMGDGVLIYFGYPQAHEDDAERAIRTALAIVERIARLRLASGALAVRVGIATGVVIVGDVIGSGEAQERGILGETPNLASRLQGLAEPNAVMIAGSTRQLVGELFEYRDLGLFEIKGFHNPIPVWQVLRPSGVVSRFEALHAPRLTPLVGREEEVHLLSRLWQRAKVGEGQIVLISGEPGIGKSRLSVALERQLGRESYTPLRYFCSPHHCDSALYPFIAQIERAAGFTREDRPETKLDKLEALLDESGKQSIGIPRIFADLLAVPLGERYPPGPSDPHRKRELTFAALLGQLELLSRERPVLMIFEDAHWADPTSLELLDKATELVPRLPILMVITFRPEFLPPWVGQAHVTSVALSRLGNREITALVGGITGGKALPPEILARIVERTDGIPLFVEELTEAVLEGGLLREEQGGYVLAGPLPQLAIPSSLQASLLARLDRLMPVKEVAQIGAALGREFSFELLNAVSRHTEIDQLEALNQLTEAGLVFRRGLPPHATFTFKHALVQDAAYSTLLRAQRQELHARIGRVLEERYGEVAETQPEIVAHHYTEAGLHELAVTYWHRAGERALQRSANSEAASHLTNAINLIATLPAGPDRDRRELRAQVALALAIRAIKGQASDETVKVYARVRELLDEATPVKEQVAIFYGLCSINVIRGEYDVAFSVAQQALTLSTQCQDAEVSAFAHRMMGSTLCFTGQFAEAVPHFERTIELYAPGHANVTDLRYSQDHAVWALSMLALVLYVLGYPKQAEDGITRAISWAQNIGHGMTSGFALGFGSILNGLLRFDQRWDGDFSGQVLAYCEEQDLQAFQPWALFYRGLSLHRSGEVPQAVEMMQQGMDRAEKISMKMLRPLHLSYLAEAHADAGTHETAGELLDEALSIIGKTNERVFEAEVERIRGEILIRAGQVGQAEAALGRALHVARAQQARMWELRAAASLARLWRDQGKSSEARDLIAPIYGWFSEGFDTPDLKDAKALLDTTTRSPGQVRPSPPGSEVRSWHEAALRVIDGRSAVEGEAAVARTQRPSSCA